MSVLDRVKLFLPVIEKANQELEQKIRIEGIESVRIDNHLVSGAADGEGGDKQMDQDEGVDVEDDDEDDEDDDEEEEDDDEEEEEEEDEVSGMKGAHSSTKKFLGGGGGGGGGNSKKIIQLEFALGDFDDTPIAQAAAHLAQLQEQRGEEGGGGEEEEEEEEDRQASIFGLKIVKSSS